jgi:adenosylcobinamide kinase/adenosylcobinamide-phosphate guanylyltransferase
MLPPVSLILGGARSGKSRYAEGLVEAHSGPCVYLATAEAGDGEMAARIAAHQARRSARWITVEESFDLCGALKAAAGADRAVLVDCLTLWLSNLMAADRDVEAESRRLVECLAALDGPVVLVSNEVGQGIVPENALARAFRDQAGWLNQAAAAAADQVVYMVAGLPLVVKGAPP